MTDRSEESMRPSRYRDGYVNGHAKGMEDCQPEIDRLRAALQKIAFTTGGIDTPSTSNAAHYIAVEALNQQSTGQEKA